MIYQNGIRVAHAIAPRSIEEYWASPSIAPRIVPASEGQIIELRVAVTAGNGTVTAGIYGDSSAYLTVKVIE